MNRPTLPIILILMTFPACAGTFIHQVVDASEDRPAKPYIKMAGDISEDGLPDIVMASAHGGGAVWYVYPDWERRIIRNEGTFSEEGALADLDGDGDLDAVLPGMKGIHWYENPGRTAAGSWLEHFIGSDGTNVHDLSLADLDGDNQLEVVARYEKEKGRPLMLWTRDTAGNWDSISIQDHYGEGLGVGDIDGDGDKDLVLNEICLLNSSNIRCWKAVRYAENVPDQMKVVCADLDGNGVDEIITSPQSWVPEGCEARISCYFLDMMHSEPTWQEVILQEGSDEVHKIHGIAVGDMDGDGWKDITISRRHDARGGGELSIFYNLDGTGRKWKKVVVSRGGSHNHQVVDIGGDGDLDILGANWNDEAVVEVWIQE